MGDQVVAVRLAVERHEVFEGLVADHDARGMHSRVAGQSFEPQRIIQQFPGLGIVLVFALQVRRHHLALVVRSGRLDPQGDFEGRLGTLRHHFGEPFRARDVPAEHPGAILDRRSGLERPVGDDLSDVAVFFAHVADHPCPTLLADVDVDVRILLPLGVGEALEEESVPDGIHGGHIERIAEQGGHAAAAGRSGNSVFTRKAHEVVDDQEVGAVSLAFDDAELPFQALPVFLRGLAVWEPVPEALPGPGAEVLLRGGAVRRMEKRQVLPGKVELEVAHFGNAHGVAHGLGPMAQPLLHFLGTLEVQLLGVFELPGFTELFLHGDAGQHVVRALVAPA